MDINNNNNSTSININNSQTVDVTLNYLYNLYPYKAAYSNVEGGAGIYGCYNYAVITTTVTR